LRSASDACGSSRSAPIVPSSTTPRASDALRKALSQMRERLDRLAIAEQRLMPKGKPPVRTAFAGLDPRLVGELEDDTIVLADWLDRERLEGLLDVSDEIAAHQKRLADCSPSTSDQGRAAARRDRARDARARRAYAELDRHRRGMAEDVLDSTSTRRDPGPGRSGCIDEVRKLIRAGDPVRAQQKLEQCRQQQERRRARSRARSPPCAATSSATSRRSSTRS